MDEPGWDGESEGMMVRLNATALKNGIGSRGKCARFKYQAGMIEKISRYGVLTVIYSDEHGEIRSTGHAKLFEMASQDEPPEGFGEDEINKALRNGQCICCKQKDSENTAIAERLKACEASWERHKVRERYMADLVFEHIKHGNEKHQGWLKEKLVEIFTLNGTKAQEAFDALTDERDRARAEVEELKQAGNEMKASYDDIVRDMQAELARMKADPEILVRWQAAEAQRAWEGTQS